MWPSLQTQHVRKGAVFVSVPKSIGLKTLNEFRSVAHSSILMKKSERLVRSEFLIKTERALDPLHSAYRSHRKVEDATTTLLNLLLKHFEGSGSHARLFFFCAVFSSAFNTVQPHVPASWLLEQSGLNMNLLGWILDWSFVWPTLLLYWLCTRMFAFRHSIHPLHKRVGVNTKTGPL